MALSKVTFTRQDGNLTTALTGEDHISGLIFDVTTFQSTHADGDIFEIFSVKEAEALGVTAYDASESAVNYIYGIPHLHISEFFRINPGASLYISFSDCSSNWDIIDQMQRVSNGKIRQFGVWTSQKLLEPGTTTADIYSLRVAGDLNAKAESLAAIGQPVSIVLSANLVSIDAAGDTTDLMLLPTITDSDFSRVTCLIGQGNSDTVRAIQYANPEHATVGCVGCVLGLVSKAAVNNSIAWVSQFNISGGEMDNVALGFGDVTVDDDALTNVYPIESITSGQLDEIEGKGYVFPMKYTGLSGTYMSSSRTCSIGDYRTIERNRVIDKSRRNMRATLLPFLNQDISINATTGRISVAQIKIYKQAVANVLQAMQDNDEISGFKITIDPTQNVLINDTLMIVYGIVPKGKSSQIEVSEGFTVSTT